MKKLIAFVLLLSVLMLSSCQYIPFLSGDEGAEQSENQNSDELQCYDQSDSGFPEGYTGGWDITGSSMSYYWVETYDECVAAIELLKSHGSTFASSAIFNCEDEFVDVKYCFGFSHHSKGDRIKYGENPFERYYADVWVTSVGFYEDVTIEELVYSNIEDYEAFGFYSTSDSVIDEEFTTENEFLQALEYRKSSNIEKSYEGTINNRVAFILSNISEEYVESVFNSIRIIDPNASGF